MVEVINTLGPKQTDSYRAGQHYLNQKKITGRLQLYSSYEELLGNLERLGGQLLLIPTAFQVATGSFSWGDVHYRFLEKLDLLDSFVYELEPVVLVRKIATTSKRVYTHRATKELLHALPLGKLEVVYTPSKYEAYQRYLVDGRYALTNKYNLILGQGEVVEQEYHVKMIWALYRIKGEWEWK